MARVNTLGFYPTVESICGYMYGVHSTIDGMNYRERCLGGRRNAVCDVVGDTEEAINWLLEVTL